ncbi:MAG: hypothetical protein QXZ02_06885 [Candidatus Bathyarchaeia archaeon]
MPTTPPKAQSLLNKTTKNTVVNVATIRHEIAFAKLLIGFSKFKISLSAKLQYLKV